MSKITSPQSSATQALKLRSGCTNYKCRHRKYSATSFFWDIGTQTFIFLFSFGDFSGIAPNCQQSLNQSSQCPTQSWPCHCLESRQTAIPQSTAAPEHTAPCPNWAFLTLQKQWSRRETPFNSATSEPLSQGGCWLILRVTCPGDKGYSGTN